MRYQKVVNKNGVETARYNYVYADGQLILLSYTANGTTQNAKFIYGSTGEVLGFIVDGTTQYLYVKNLQGDIVAIVNESGVPVVRYIYDAWGNVTITTDTGYENLINLSPFAYRGYCYDNDIKMYYLQSRYYDPQICRFINADSSEYLGATGTVLSCNLFAYCENDPVNYLDCSGCASTKQFKSAKLAAKDFAKSYYNMSLYIRLEMSSIIYSFKEKGKTYYSYTPYIVGKPHSCNPFDGKKLVPKGCVIVAVIHTHPNENDFSSGDKGFAKQHEIAVYLVVPKGNVYVYHNTSNGFKTETVYSFLIFKKLSRNKKSDLKKQYESIWNRYKSNCNCCKKKGWPCE